jgi:hypothetical protein
LGASNEEVGMMRRWVVTGTVLAALLCAAPALAQGRQWGVRGGVSADPDQFFVGGHYETRPIVERLTFKPNVEIGFDDESMLAAINFDIAWTIPVRNKPFSVYFGGGPSVNIFNRDDDGDPPGDEDHVGPGFNFMGGLQLNQGLFFEIKLGVVDSPDFKFTIGYAFR